MSAKIRWSVEYIVNRRVEWRIAGEEPDPTQEAVASAQGCAGALARRLAPATTPEPAAQAVAAPAPDAPQGLAARVECHGLDTQTRICFYEHDFYPLSNFSAFTLEWKGLRFGTSEAAYHWEKFPDAPSLQAIIHGAISAHEAFKLAEQYRTARRKDWEAVKVGIMREILREKARQHEYVRRKLLATGERELVEDSWRDDFWGWGPNRDGRNELGKLWMELRASLAREAAGRVR